MSAKSISERTPRGQGQLILVVEDVPMVRHLAKISLRFHGYEVITAQDGGQGLAAFARHRDSIRAVLTDTLMPVMDGVQMTRAIRELDPQMAIISASGCPDPEVTAAYQALKVTAFLHKPYRQSELLAILATVMQQSQRSP